MYEQRMVAVKYRNALLTAMTCNTPQFVQKFDNWLTVYRISDQFKLRIKVHRLLLSNGIKQLLDHFQEV